MKNIYLKKIIIYISSGITFLFGEWDMAMKALVCFIILDYITGIISGIYLKELSSKKNFKGIVKKVLLLTIVAVATILDELIGTNGLTRGMIIYFFIGTEGISILENCIKCDIEIPSYIVEKLEQFKKEKENNDKNL